MEKLWKSANKGRDKSIDWFSSKLEIPSEKKPKQIPTLVEEENSYDDLDDYMPTEQYDGGFNIKLHPHCLTGAKGFETSYNLDNLQESFSLEDDEDYEDLLAPQTCHVIGSNYKDSDKLECISQLSDESQEVQKLALYTEEEDFLSPNEKPQKEFPRVSILPSTAGMETKNSQKFKDFDWVLSQSPAQKISTNEVDKWFQDVDEEILITQESNEYELEEWAIFDQGNNDHKVYQCLLRNGNLLRKQKLNKKKPIGSSRTSIKSAYSSLSSISQYRTHSYCKPTQRSSTLLRNKVKQIKNKMSGKKTHLRNKSRNLEQTLTKKPSARNHLESIPEFSKKLRPNYSHLN